jgi:putative hydrolase of the HAD superfamily
VAQGIDAVLFDFGGVFTESPFQVVEEAGAEMGAAPGQLLEIMFGPYERDTDHVWHRLERGEIAVLDAREELIELGRSQGFEFDPFEILGRTVANKGVRAPMIECARSLRERGLRTGIVTNNVREFGAGWRKMIPVEEIFDVVVDSSEIGVRKPSLEIYRIALREVDVSDPGRAIFLDDLPSNVAAAERVGIRGVLVPEDFERALEELHRLVG